MQIPPIWFETTGRGKHVYVMPDPVEKCLRLVPVCNMESLLAKMRERALADPAMNRALLVVGKNAEQITVDDEGCIRISEKLLEFAKHEGYLARFKERHIRLLDSCTIQLVPNSIVRRELFAVLALMGRKRGTAGAGKTAESVNLKSAIG